MGLLGTESNVFITNSANFDDQLPIKTSEKIININYPYHHFSYKITVGITMLYYVALLIAIFSKCKLFSNLCTTIFDVDVFVKGL